MVEKSKIQEISDKIEEAGQLAELESMILNNVLEFKSGEKEYRVRKPSLRENNDLNYKRMVKYQEMLKDPNYMLEDQLKKTYKEKGVDLDNMDMDLITLQKREADLLSRIAKLKVDSDIGRLKDEICNIREQKADLLQKKSQLLQFSIETQLTNYMNEYLLSLVLETKDDEGWCRVYKSHEELLESSNEDLLIKATYFLSLLVYKNALQY